MIENKIQIVGTEVTAGIEARGYVAVSAREYVVPQELTGARDALLSDWDHLVLDEHLHDGGAYRERRFGVFHFDTSSQSLEYKPGQIYFQSRENNPVNGGVPREFAPLLDATVENAFLHALILCDFAQLPIPPELQISCWYVNVHQMRTIAQPGQVGKPTPEGIHHDGERFALQRFVGRQNAQGGLFTVYDNQERRIADCLQDTPFDAVYMEDHRIMHGVSDISSEDNINPATRDTLLFGYNPI